MKNIIPYNSFASLTYKLFESESSDLEIKQEIEERKQYLKDIFQELTDKNFVISIGGSVIGSYKCLVINIHYYKTGFKYKEVRDYIDSSDDYMLSNKFNKTVFKFQEYPLDFKERRRNKDFINKNSEEEIYNIKMVYSKNIYT